MHIKQLMLAELTEDLDLECPPDGHAGLVVDSLTFVRARVFWLNVIDDQLHAEAALACAT